MKTAIKLENLIDVSAEAYMRSMLCRSQNELIESVWVKAYMRSMLCRSQNELIESVWVKAYMIQPVKKAELFP